MAKSAALGTAGPASPLWRLGAGLWNGLLAAQRIIIAVFGAILVLLIFSESILRYVLHLPLMEVEEIALLLAMWMYFMGMSYGSYERSHVSAELIHLVVKGPRAYAVLCAFRTLLALALSLVLTYWSANYFVWGLERHEVSKILMLPMVYSQSALFVGTVLMSFYIGVQLVDETRQVFGKPPLVRREQQTGDSA